MTVDRWDQPPTPKRAIVLRADFRPFHLRFWVLRLVSGFGPVLDATGVCMAAIQALHERVVA